MKKLFNLSAGFLFSVTLALSAPAAAALVNPVDGTFTDTSTGYLWRTLMQYDGMSFSDAAALLPAAYHVASETELSALTSSLAVGTGTVATLQAAMGALPGNAIVWGFYRRRHALRVACRQRRRLEQQCRQLPGMDQLGLSGGARRCLPGTEPVCRQYHAGRSARTDGPGDARGGIDAGRLAIAAHVIVFCGAGRVVALRRDNYRMSRTLSMPSGCGTGQAARRCSTPGARPVNRSSICDVKIGNLAKRKPMSSPLEVKKNPLG